MVAIVFLTALLGIAVFVLLMALLSKTNTLTRKLGELEGRVSTLRREMEVLTNLVHRPDRGPSPGAAPSQEQKAAVTERPAGVAGAQPPVAESVAAPRLDRPALEVSTPGEPKLQILPIPDTAPSRTREEWEALIGGKLLNRIGALALIIGMGFFLKYAFDKNWITETMRVVIGFLTGGVLLLVASLARKKKLEVFSQGLVGAGIAVLYLSVYASFNFYHLVSQPIAFGMMAAVTALTFTQAFKQDSLAVALLGWVGGVLTPFMLSTGQANEVGLFTYIALLDAGILAILLAKEKWSLLEPLTLASTYIIFFLWYDEYYTPGDLSVTVYCLTVFWLLFFAFDIYRMIKGATGSTLLRHCVSAANAGVYYATMYMLINPDHHSIMGIVSLLIGLVYFVTGLLIRQRVVDVVFSRFVLTAIVMLVLTTSIQFTGFTTVSLWAIEAIALLWCALRLNFRSVWISGVALFGVAAIKFLATQGALSFEPIEEFVPLVNPRAGALLLLVLTSGASAIISRDRAALTHAQVTDMLHYFSCALMLLLLSVEVIDFYGRKLLIAGGHEVRDLEYSRATLLTAVWMASSLPLIWFGLKRGGKPLLRFGLVVTGVTALFGAFVGTMYQPVETFSLLVNQRVAMMLFVSAGIAVQSRWLARSADATESLQGVVLVMRMAVPILLFLMVTGETITFFEKEKILIRAQADSAQNAGALTRLDNLQQLWLSAVWLVYSIVVMGLGLWKRFRSLRIVAIVVFGITILKIFIVDLSFLDTLYRIFSFIGLGLILLGVSYVYQRYKNIILGPSPEGTARAAGEAKQ